MADDDHWHHYSFIRLLRCSRRLPVWRQLHWNHRSVPTHLALTCNLPVGLWCTRHRISSEMNAKRSRSVLSTSAMNNSHTVRDLDGIMPAVADWLRAGWTVCRATGRVGAITDRAQRSTAVPSVDAGGDGTASPNLQAHTTLFHVLEWTYSRSPAPSRVVPVGSIRPFSPCHIRSTKMYVIIKLRQTLQD